MCLTTDECNKNQIFNPKSSVAIVFLMALIVMDQKTVGIPGHVNVYEQFERQEKA